MATEINDDRKESLKAIYNSSVNLLELLNVLIPKVESYSSTIPMPLLEDIANKCFELGANIAKGCDEIAAPEEEEDNPYPFGC